MLCTGVRRAQLIGSRITLRNPWIMEVADSLSADSCKDILQKFCADDRKELGIGDDVGDETICLCNLQGWEETDSSLCCTLREGIKRYREHLSRPFSARLARTRCSFRTEATQCCVWPSEKMVGPGSTIIKWSAGGCLLTSRFSGSWQASAAPN